MNYPDVYALVSALPEAEAYIAALPVYVREQIRVSSGIAAPSPAGENRAPPSGGKA